MVWLLWIMQFSFHSDAGVAWREACGYILLGLHDYTNSHNLNEWLVYDHTQNAVGLSWLDV